jgi:GT2 family glycosyltransferase/SAM-dependent methyltransferase/glycosyltransferase involved in cell wall biosynthesis
MEFTGERYLPDMGGELRMEHVHRYAFCLPYVRNKVVLDAACGEGYGSAMLAAAAASVIGVDVSDAAVLHARDRYASLGERLRFDVGDATALNFPDAHFDVVVSFETIEHVLEQESMMAGFRRVLKRGGLLILSSPDKRTYSDEPNFLNEFHIKELYLNELRAMVGRHFKRHLLLGQRLTGGSAIFPTGDEQVDKAGRSLLLVDDGHELAERGPRLADPVYLLVMATNGSSLPAPHSSVLLTEQEDPLQSLKRIARWASGVDTEMIQLRAATGTELAQLRQQVAQAEARLQDINAQAAESSALAASVQAQSLAAESQLNDARREHDEALLDWSSQLKSAHAETEALRAQVAQRDERHAEDARDWGVQREATRAALLASEQQRELAMAEHLSQVGLLSEQLEGLQRSHDAERKEVAAQIEVQQAQQQLRIEALQTEVVTLREHKDGLNVRVADLEAAEMRWAEERRAHAVQTDGLLAQHVLQREQMARQHQEQLESLQRSQDAERKEVAARIEVQQAQQQLRTEALQTEVVTLREHKDALNARLADFEAAEMRWAEERRALTIQTDGLLAQQVLQHQQLAHQHQDLIALSETHASALAAWHQEQLTLTSELAAVRAEQRVTLTAAEAVAQEAKQREAAIEADWALRLSTQSSDWQSRLDALAAQANRDHERNAQMWSERLTAAEALMGQMRKASEEALQRAAAEAQEQQQQMADELAKTSAEHAARINALQVEALVLHRDSETEIERWRLAATESRQQLQHAQLALRRQADLAAQGLSKQQQQADQERSLLQSTHRNLQQSVKALVQVIGGELETLRLTVTTRQITAHKALLALQRAQEELHQVLQTMGEAMPAANSRAIATTPRSLAGLMTLDDLSFLREAYRGILHRELDSDGQEHYLRRMRQGEQRLRVLADLRLSPEGQRQPTKLDGLDDVVRSLRKSRIPLLGNRERQRLQTWLSATPAPIAVLDQAAPATAQITRIESALDNLERGSALLAEAVPIAVALGRAPREFGLDPWACAQELVRADSEAFVALAYALLCRRAPSSGEAQRERTRLEAGASRVYILNLLLDGSDPGLAEGGNMAPMPRSLALLSLGTGTQFPAHEHPTVSVIVVTRGRLDCTLRCLRSLLRHPPDTSFEVIVVDDGSPDGSAGVLATITGLRLVALDTPVGFAASCNAGAKVARGEWLHFLHNDSEVQSGWLDELRLTFDLFPGTGMAGSQLLRPDGRLQAAGCVVWQDGSVSPVGKGEDATQSGVSHAREVDACSTASLMVPTDLFQAVGGMALDVSGIEGADLALALAARGYRVMYQPLSRVVHHDIVARDSARTLAPSAGHADLTSPLLGRWGAVLEAYPHVGTPPDQASRHRVISHLLAIEHRLPRPDRDAGSVSVFNMLMAAREQGSHVSLLAEADVAEGKDADPRHVQMLQRSGVEVLLAPQTSCLHEYIEAHGQTLDMVLMYRPIVMERHASLVQRLCPKAKRLYYPHDLHFLRLARQAAVTGDATLAAEAQRRRTLELALQDSADLTLVASQAELQLLTDAGLGAKTRWLPLLLDTKRIEQPPEVRTGMVFVGGFHHAPNINAVRQLVEDIMPRVRDKRPDIALWIVGEAPPAELTARQDPGVHYLGPVDDLNALLGSVRLAVAPIRFGAGAKGKVARPMAAGLPVVASPEATEGMGLAGDEHLLIADSADAFAHSIIRLHDDDALWWRLADAGHKYAVDHWGPKAAASRMAQIMLSQGLRIRESPFGTRFFNEATHLRLASSNKPTSPD